MNPIRYYTRLAVVCILAGILTAGTWTITTYADNHSHTCPNGQPPQTIDLTNIETWTIPTPPDGHTLTTVTVTYRRPNGNTGTLNLPPRPGAVYYPGDLYAETVTGYVCYAPIPPATTTTTTAPPAASSTTTSTTGPPPAAQVTAPARRVTWPATPDGPTGDLCNDDLTWFPYFPCDTTTTTAPPPASTAPPSVSVPVTLPATGATTPILGLGALVLLLMGAAALVTTRRPR